MADIFNLPRIGDAMAEGEIVEWFVAVGDTVDLDQVICAVETDKSVVELTSPHRGQVLHLGGEPGAVLQVGDPLLVVGQPGESLPQLTSAPPPDSAGSSASTPQPTNTPSTPANAKGVGQPITSPLVRRLAAEHRVDIAVVAGTGAGGRITRDDVMAAAAAPSAVPPAISPTPAMSPTRAMSPAAASNGTVRAMPKVRKLAREQNIDLRQLRGSGPDGAITADDLDRIVHGGTGTAAPRRERLSALRRSIGAHLTESVQTIPQFTSTVDVDATAVIATRKALQERTGEPVPVDAVLMALLIPVLHDHPRMNAWLDGDEVEYHNRFDIGVAVDTPDGLIVPVIRNADQRRVTELASDIVRVAQAARNRSIQPAELAGATCTVNNVGAVGIETGTPILPIGTSTIVAFGRTRPVVQLRNGNPVEVPTMTLCATFDHRLIDGGDAGRFLTQLRQHLEVPALGLL